MNSGLILFRLATAGASEFRSALRQSVKATTSYLNNFDSIRRVGTAIPPELLGSELFNTLQGNLHELVQEPDASQIANEFYSSRAIWQSPETSSRSTELAPDHIEKEKSHPTWPAPGITTRAERNIRQNQSQKTSTKVFSGMKEEPSKHHQAILPSIEMFPQSRLSSVPNIATTKKTTKQSVSILGSTLKRYFELVEQRAFDMRRMQESSPVPTVQRNSQPHPGAPLNLPLVRSGSEIAAIGAAERIRGVLESSSPLSTSRIKQKIRSSQPNRVDIRNVFQIQAPEHQGSAEFQRDFAQNLADLLREQAMEYGIDDV